MILFITTGPFFPTDRGGKIRTNFFFETLAEIDDICILSVVSSKKDIISLKKLYFYKNVKKIYYVYIKKENIYKRTIKNLFNSNSIFLEKYGSNLKLSKKLSNIIRTEKPKTIFLSHFHLSSLIKNIPPNIKKLIDLQNIGSDLIKSYYSYLNIPVSLISFWQFIKLRKEEKNYLKLFDHIFICSKNNKKKIININKNITVVPNIVTNDFFNFSKNNKKIYDIGFCGAFNYNPNLKTAKRILKIMKILSDLKCILVGKCLNLKNTENIHITGYVKDIKEHITKAKIFIAPIIEGGGTKLKILQAAALKIPIITTKQGISGLMMKNNIHCIITKPKNFPNEIKKLLKNKKLQNKLAENAFKYIKNFSYEKIKHSLKDKIESLHNKKYI